MEFVIFSLFSDFDFDSNEIISFQIEPIQVW